MSGVKINRRRNVIIENENVSENQCISGISKRITMYGVAYNRK
jgi:hypothetical protein